MQSFYTNVQVYGSKILYRGVENGRRVMKKLEYHPTLFLQSSTPTKYTTISGEYMSSIKPGTIRDCRDFINKYKDIDNFKVYGNQKYEYAYISDLYANEYIDWDKNLIHVANIDIEVGSENGFPDPGLANESITAITCRMHDGIFVYGCRGFVNTRADVTYIRCSDEIDLIKRFLDRWTLNYPDIVTGWNIKFFDIPYLVNRITKILGESQANRLSPWHKVTNRTTYIMGKEHIAYSLLGIGTLDYIELYKKFVLKPQESYKLDHICHEELGERKLSYEEYGNLHTLYKEDFQKFIEYNIRDVELVDKLDDKLKLIDLALTLAYDSKSNYDDVFAQVRMWDNIIFNELRKDHKVLPPITSHDKDEAYVGAYVKDPMIGLHNWVASFDLNSLYPHLIMQFNISPDKFIEPENYTDEMREIISQNVNIDSMLNKEVDTRALKKLGVTLTPNGQLFKVDSQGFLAHIMETMYDDRSKYKEKAIEAKKELEKETDKEKRIEIEKRIARFNNLQLAKKVSLNSAYGALGNQYFRFFDVRQASAITTSGQLAIRWIEKKLNGYLNTVLGSSNKDYVIASDTDSIYLSLDDLVRKTILASNPSSGTKQTITFLDKVCETKIQPFIDKSYNELAEYTNALAQKMIMKREALADKGIWTAKKRYILNVYNNEGVEYAKPKVKVMGLEVKKSSTPTFFRDKMEQCIQLMLNSTEKDLIDFIDSVREEMRSVEITDIAFPRGVNGLEKFSNKQTIYSKGCPIHVRGSLIYNNLLLTKKLDKKYPTIKEGEKIKFIYMKEPNTIKSNIIAFPTSLPVEFDLGKYVDYETQFVKAFLEPIKIITDSIGWKTENVSSLESFFT